MNIGIIGLGRMGNSIAFRLLNAGHTVYGFDIDKESQEHAAAMGVSLVDKMNDMPAVTPVMWLMVPASIVDNVLHDLMPHCTPHSIIIDGGNSYFIDSIARANNVERFKSYFLDIGTSGGLQGRDLGFSLMIGGSREAYQHAEPFFKAIAFPNGYGYVGPSGAGHYVKMIHNGIEYALLQAYAEGFDLLKHGCYKNLDLEEISRIWVNGSVIRSWILELIHNIYTEHPDFNAIIGTIGGGQTGRWTVQEAQRAHIPTPLIAESLKIRDESKKTGGNYATKLVALLRNKFGGHAVEYKK